MKCKVCNRDTPEEFCSSDCEVRYNVQTYEALHPKWFRRGDVVKFRYPKEGEEDTRLYVHATWGSGWVLAETITNLRISPTNTYSQDDLEMVKPVDTYPRPRRP